MADRKKELTRRKFLEVSAAGAAGAMALSAGTPSILSAAPRRGGTVTCGMSFLIQSPDPQRRTGTWAKQDSALCWEGLLDTISLGERFKIIEEKGPDAIPAVKPMLADAYDIEKDGSRYVFHLKRGVKFHNGKELGSDDVKWSWERIADPAVRSSSRKILTSYLKSIETPDQYTAVANLTQPYAAFLVANAWINTVILPKDCIPKGKIFGESKDYKPDRAAPPGTGPFEMVEFQQKQQAVFKAFKDYRVPELPYLDKIIYKVISKDQPRTMALRAGNIDYAYAVEPRYFAEAIKGQKLYKPFQKDGMEFYPRLGNAVLTIYLNSHPTKGNSPFKNLRVRQALNLSIDRKKLANALYGPLAFPKAQGFHQQESMWGFDDITFPEPDIPKARQLLKEAGYPNGLDVEFKITPTWGRNDFMAQIVQQMAKAAGFRIKITPLVGLQYWANLRKSTFQMFVFTLDDDDPMGKHFGYMHTDPMKPYDGFAPATGIKDPIMDKLLDEMAAEIDIKKRRAKFKEIVLRMNEQVYFIPYAATIGSNGWTTKLKNFKPWNYAWPEQAFREAWI